MLRLRLCLRRYPRPRPLLLSRVPSRGTVGLRLSTRDRHTGRVAVWGMIDPMDQPDPMDLATARCRARARSGARCRRWPIAGGTVCVSHGGKAPQVARVAAERLDLARLVYAARLYSPEDVMEQCVRIARALLDVAVQSGRLVDVADALDRAARVAHL